jgi:hypothetical protein
VETIQLTRTDLAGGQLENLVLDEAGVLLVKDEEVNGRYHSPTIRAPFAFNAVVPRWQADLPPGGAVALYVRTGSGSSWSDWYDVHAHGDWTLPGAAQQVGDMVFVNDQASQPIPISNLPSNLRGRQRCTASNSPLLTAAADRPRPNC